MQLNNETTTTRSCMQSASSSTTTTTSTNKNVAFTNSVTVFFVRHVQDLTAQELKDSFYSRDEFQDFRRDVKQTVRMIEQEQDQIENYDDHRQQDHDIIDDEGIEFCRRGLESRTKQGMKLKVRSRRMAVFSVLEEQQRQHHQNEERNNQYMNEQKIATLYARFARQSRERAYMAGLADAAVALKENSVEEERNCIAEKDVELIKSTPTPRCEHLIKKPIRLRACVHSSAA